MDGFYEDDDGELVYRLDYSLHDKTFYCFIVHASLLSDGTYIIGRKNTNINL